MVQRNFSTVFSQDVAAARDWYVELLGYRVAFDSDWFVQLESPEVAAVELGILAADHELVPNEYRAAPAGAMLTVVVDDVDGVHTRAVERGETIVEAPRDLFYGQRRMLVVGPDGLLIDVSSECEPDPEWLASLG